MRSGTSVGANYRAVCRARSDKEFIAKLNIVLEEADETQYWLLLCNQSVNYPNTNELLENLKEIQKIINSILKTAKKKLH